jgi:hypothetical protein
VAGGVCNSGDFWTMHYIGVDEQWHDSSFELVGITSLSSHDYDIS